MERRWDERSQSCPPFCHLPVHLDRNLIVLSSSTATECLPNISAVRPEPIRPTTDGLSTSHPVLRRKPSNELPESLRIRSSNRLLFAILPTGNLATPCASSSAARCAGRNVHQKPDRQPQCQCIPPHGHGKQDWSVVHPTRSQCANGGNLPVWNPSFILPRRAVLT